MRIAKRKWSTATGRCTEAFSWSVEALGTDQHGTWLGSRRGNSVQQPDGRIELQRHDAVWLAVEDAWYLPAFWFTTDTDLTIDLCTPPTFSGETWSFVDLELDLFRRPDGRAGIVDQDEWDLLPGRGSSPRMRSGPLAKPPGPCSRSWRTGWSPSAARPCLGFTALRTDRPTGQVADWNSDGQWTGRD